MADITYLNLKEEADILFDSEKYDKALSVYLEAEKFTLNQMEKCENYLAIGDTYYMLSDYENALAYLFKTFEDEAIANSSYVNYRIGKCFQIIGDVGKARLYFLKAFEMDGELAFVDDMDTLKLIEEII